MSRKKLSDKDLSNCKNKTLKLANTFSDFKQDTYTLICNQPGIIYDNEANYLVFSFSIPAEKIKKSDHLNFVFAKKLAKIKLEKKQLREAILDKKTLNTYTVRFLVNKNTLDTFIYYHGLYYLGKSVSV